MKGNHHLDTMLGDLPTGDLASLVDELKAACPWAAGAGPNLPLIVFLTLCLHPPMAGKRQPIDTSGLLDGGLLTARVGRIHDGELRELCAELAQHTPLALEFHHGRTLAALISRGVPKPPQPAKPGAKAAAVEALTMKRRANRL